MKFEIANNGNVTINGSGTMLTVGGGTGKVSMGTIDPPYTINGEKYATYLAAMVGQKEEVTGTIDTMTPVVGVGFKATIDFLNAPKASDIWLFNKVTNLRAHIKDLVVLISASNNARTWYSIDREKMTLTVYSSRPTTISYRLTAPRFDAVQWKNTRDDDSPGFIINDPDVLSAGVQDISSVPSFITGMTISPATSGSQTGIFYTLKDQTGAFVYEVAAYSEAMISNLTAGAIKAKDISVERLSVGGKSIQELVSESLLSSGQVISFMISVSQDELTKKTILTPTRDDSSGVAIKLKESQTLSIVDQNGGEVSSFDAKGNSTISGSLTAKDAKFDTLTTEKFKNSGDATVSGSLYVDRVVTRFGDLDEKLLAISHELSAVSDQSIATQSSSEVRLQEDLSARQASVSSSLSSLESRLSNLEQQSDELTSLPLSSTSSALLALGIRNEVIDTREYVYFERDILMTSLSVSGATSLGATSVTGSLLVDGKLSVIGSEIESIGDTLYLQKGKSANLDVMAGTLIVTSGGEVQIHGNVSIFGNIALSGVLGVSTIRPYDSGDVSIDLSHTTASESGTFGRLIVRGLHGEEVVKIDDKGSARFQGDLSARQATFSGVLSSTSLETRDATVSGDLSVGGRFISGGRSVGVNVTVATGSSELVISGLGRLSNEYVVNVQPSWNTTTWIHSKTPDQFIMSFGTQAPASASADWFLIEKK
jgi:hypothetical protein